MSPNYEIRVSWGTTGSIVAVDTRGYAMYCNAPLYLRPDDVPEYEVADLVAHFLHGYNVPGRFKLEKSGEGHWPGTSRPKTKIWTFKEEAQ